jgi:hypothetical protein
VLLLPRFRLLQFLFGLYNCLFRHALLSLGVLRLR